MNNKSRRPSFFRPNRQATLSEKTVVARLRGCAGISVLRGVLKEYIASPDASLPCRLEVDGETLTLTGERDGVCEVRRIELSRIGCRVPLTEAESEALRRLLIDDLSAHTDIKSDGGLLCRR